MVRTTSGMTFIVSGEMREEVTGREVLSMVLRDKSVEFGNLHISSIDGIAGDIAIYRGTHVIGARVSGRNISDWEALKLLLETKTGSYSYVDYQLRFPCNPKSELKVRLTDLITYWPNLPASPGQMKCGRTSFNRILAYSGENKADQEPFYVEWTRAGIRLCLKQK